MLSEELCSINTLHILELSDYSICYIQYLRIALRKRIRNFYINSTEDRTCKYYLFCGANYCTIIVENVPFYRDRLVDKRFWNRNLYFLSDILAIHNLVYRKLNILSMLVCSIYLYVRSIYIIIVNTSKFHSTLKWSSVSNLKLHCECRNTSDILTWLCSTLSNSINSLDSINSYRLESEVIVRSYSTCRVTSLILSLKSVCDARSLVSILIESCVASECFYISRSLHIDRELIETVTEVLSGTSNSKDWIVLSYNLSFTERNQCRFLVSAVNNLYRRTSEVDLSRVDGRIDITTFTWHDDIIFLESNCVLLTFVWEYHFIISNLAITDSFRSLTVVDDACDEVREVTRDNGETRLDSNYAIINSLEVSSNYVDRIVCLFDIAIKTTNLCCNTSTEIIDINSDRIQAILNVVSQLSNSSINSSTIVLWKSISYGIEAFTQHSYLAIEYLEAISNLWKTTVELSKICSVHLCQRVKFRNSRLVCSDSTLSCSNLTFSSFQSCTKTIELLGKFSKIILNTIDSSVKLSYCIRKLLLCSIVSLEVIADRLSEGVSIISSLLCLLNSIIKILVCQ